jgi:hypothetical protein
MQGQKDVDLKEEEFICVATFLPLKSWNYMIPFSADDLKRTEAGKGNQRHNEVYAVKADFQKKRFWTLSLWKDRGSLWRFIMAQPPMQLLSRSSLNGLERTLHLLNGLTQMISLIGQWLWSGSRIPPFTKRTENNLQMKITLKVTRCIWH